MQDLRPTGSKPPADFRVGDFEKLHGTRDAIAVALALLDELLQIPPERPDRPSLKEVEDVLREIRDIAVTGVRSVREAQAGASE
jgi:hypothetical protein